MIFFIEVKCNPSKDLIQSGNEFGWYQTSGSKNQPFGHSFPVDLSNELCKRVYGEQFTGQSLQSKIRQVNKIYKGLNISVKNVYFTHGELDPWRPMGVQKDRNKFSPTDIVPGASHCNDLYSISLSDSPEMMLVKLRARTLILEWLK